MFHKICITVSKVLCSYNYNNNASSLVSFFSLPLSSFLFTLSIAVFTVYLSWLTQLDDGQGPVLMTTVAMPVFSTKNETVSSPWVL